MAKDYLGQAGTFLQAEASKKAAEPKRKPAQTAKKKNADKTPAEPIKADTIPAGYILKPEPKSKHLNLLLQQSVYDALKAKAEAAGTSVNDLANQILKEATL